MVPVDRLLRDIEHGLHKCSKKLNLFFIILSGMATIIIHIEYAQSHENHKILTSVRVGDTTRQSKYLKPDYSGPYRYPNRRTGRRRPGGKECVIL